MVVDVVVARRRVGLAPVRVVAALFVISVVGVVLALVLGGAVQWTAAIVAMAAPVAAEHVLWRWRRLVHRIDV